MLFRTLVIAIVILAVGGLTALSRATPVPDAGKPAAVVFVCRNGVSMSVWSAAYFNRLAVQRGLPQRATSRSSLLPSGGVPFRMRAALAVDGFRLGGYQPRIIDAADARNADVVVVIEGGTTLPPELQVPEHTSTEYWNGFPAMRDQYFPSRAELRRRVEALVERLSAGTTVMTRQGVTRKVDFSQDTIDQQPKGFEFAHTARVGRPGKWIVQNDGGNKVLAQTDADATGSRFPVAVVSDVVAADVDVSVRFKPISGRIDQAAGLVWRYQNEDNYYLLRANALEDNVVLYKVENGRRTDLPVKGQWFGYGKRADVPAAQWSTLRVVATGRVFEVYFNGARLYEVEDSTFPHAGKVGVWTKADSVTQFDDITVMAK